MIVGRVGIVGRLVSKVERVDKEVGRVGRERVGRGRVGRGRVGSGASCPASFEVCISGAVSQRHG
jgi:hypothetical protein